jgi:hypothetical protein
MKRLFFFMDTCEPLITSTLRMPGFYKLCSYIGAPKSHSSGEPCIHAMISPLRSSDARIDPFKGMKSELTNAQ